MSEKISCGGLMERRDMCLVEVLGFAWQPGETCDDGNAVDGDGCSAICAVEVTSSCGDGVLNVTAGEVCDDGVNNGTGPGLCEPGCQAPAQCGNGLVEMGTFVAILLGPIGLVLRWRSPWR